VSRSIILVVVAALLWSTTGTAAFLLGENASPFAIGAAVFGFGGALLAVIGGSGSLNIWRDRSLVPWLVLGSLGVVAYPLFFYAGMSLAGIALGNVVALVLGPLTSAVLEWTLDRRPPSPRWWFASTGAMGGVILMSFSDIELGGGRSANVALGLVFALGAGVAYGTYTFALSRIIRAGNSSRSASGSLFGAAAPILLVVLFFTCSSLTFSWSTLGLLSYLAVGPVVVAYLAFSAALRSLRSSSVGTLALVEPLGATILAIVIVGESLGALAIAGMALVLVSLVLLALHVDERHSSRSAYS
jgi:DME family drug/metabolite transporter